MLTPMAKVTFGPVVSEARGACGTQVFARDRGGAYVRAKAKVVNPKTSYQATVRAWEKTIAKAWSTSLTDQQRQGWRELADLITRSNVLGDKTSLSGFHTFCQSNLNLIHAGLAPLHDPPPALAATDPGELSASASASAPQLLLNPTTAPPNGWGFIAKATKNLTPGVNFFAHRLRQLWPGNASPLYDPFTETTLIPPWSIAQIYGNPFSSGGGQLTSGGGYYASTLWRGNTAWTNYTMTFTFRASATNNFCGGPIFMVNPSTGASYLMRAIPQNAEIVLYKLNQWYYTYNMTPLAYWGYSFDTNAHAWEVDCQPPNFTLKIDATQIGTYADPSYTAGALGFVSDAIDAYYGPLTVTGNLAIPLTLPDITAAYASKFGPLTQGKKIGLTLAYVNPANGCKSPTQSTLITIAA
jgi:hypothetical protein